MWPRKPEPVAPDMLDVQNAANKAEILNSENNSTNAEMQAAGGIAFDFQVIDDEKFLGLFDPKNDLYCEHLAPLLPLFSRMNYLTNCTLIDAAAYKLKVDIAVTQLKNQIEFSIECIVERNKVYMLLDSMLGYAEMRINDSIGGFKLIQLTERTKNIKLTEVSPESQKKRGLFG